MSVDKPQSINTIAVWLELVLVAFFAFDVLTEPNAMDVDSAFAPSDEDTLEDRHYWMASACPCREQCSASSWGRVLKYSYLNDEVVRGHIQEHLTSSSLHNLSKEDAEHHAALAVVEVFTETAEERRAYRQQVKRAQAQSADKGKSKGKPRDDKRMAEAQRMQSTIKRLKGELSELRSGAMDNNPGSSSSFEAFAPSASGGWSASGHVG